MTEKKVSSGGVCVTIRGKAVRSSRSCLNRVSRRMDRGIYATNRDQKIEQLIYY